MGILSTIVTMSQWEIDNPTSRQVADTFSTYMLDQAPYTRYQSDGENLLPIRTGPPDEFIQAWEPKYGGYWDGTNADDAALQAVLDEAATFSPPKAVMLPPVVCIKNGVYPTSSVYVFGYNFSEGKINTQVIPHASMSLTTGFMFNFNTTDGTTVVSSVANGQRFQCGLFGVWLNNTNANKSGARLSVMAGTFIARYIRGSNCTQLIKRIAGAYIDNGSINWILSSASKDNSEYMLEIGAAGGLGGDGLTISNLNITVSEAQLALSVTGTGGCRISEVINGTIKVKNSYAVELSNIHQEQGQLLFENSSWAVRSSMIEVAGGNSYYPIDCTTSTSTHQVYEGLLDDVVFRYGAILFEGTNIAEVRTSYQTKITCRNARRIINSVSGQYAPQGIRIVNSDDSALAAWIAGAHYLSLNGSTYAGASIGSTYAKLVADFTGLSAPVLSSDYGTSTLANATTYYYTAQLLIDTSGPTGRNQSGAEVSKLTTATNQRIGMALGLGTSSKMCIIRIYRGTSTGSYNFYADIPSQSVYYIADSGAYVNGVAWVARGAAAVDSITVTTGNWLVTPGGKVAVA